MSKLGTYNIHTSDKSKVFNDSLLIHSTAEHYKERFGVLVSNENLYNANKLFARKSKTKAGVFNTTNLYFEDTNLSTTSDTIFVTREEYNNIIQNKLTGGQRSFDLAASYKIIDAILEDNEEEFVNEDGGLGATYLSTECPVLFVKYFEATVGKDSVITLEYFVDNKRLDSIHKGIIEDTFTLYVYDSEDVLLTKQTTFAGWHTIDLPTSLTSQYGETYFSVKCVDNHKVGSSTSWFDVLVKNLAYENFYQMTSNDLSFTYENKSYNIVPNDNTELVAYKNKIALSVFFQKVKASGYNGVVMYNNSDTIYWLSYKTNLLASRSAIADIDAAVDLGIHKFYRVEVTQGTNNRVVSEITEVDEDTAFTAFKNYTNSSDEIVTIEDDVLPSAETAYYAYHPNQNLSDTTSLNESLKLLYFHRKFCKYYYIKHKVENGRHVFSWDGYDDNWTVIKPIFHIMNSGESSSLSFSVGSTTSLAVGTHYYVYSNVDDYRPYLKGSGDNLIFPDNFTIDLNGATIKATECYEPMTPELVMLFRNVDTHIKNGKIFGNYENYDMIHGCLFQMGGRTYNQRNATPNEWYHVVAFEGSKFCSLENVEIGWCVGYGCVSDAAKAIPDKGEAHGAPLGFNRSGAIDFYGNEVNTDDATAIMCRTQYVSNQNTDLYFPVTADKGFTNEICIGNNQGLADGFLQGETQRKDRFEIFVAAYDANKNHIKTLKCRLNDRIILPVNSAYIRACGYKRLDAEGSKISNTWYRSNIKTCNTIIKNSYIHDMRTIAINAANAYNYVHINNRYKNIAKEVSRPVTSVFGDIEDSHWLLNRFIMRDCINEGGGGTNWVVNEVHWLEFTGNKNIGLGITNTSIFGALISNNIMPVLRINQVSEGYAFPGLIIKNNLISNLNLSRIYRMEDFNVANPTITVTNCKIDETCRYHYLNSIRSWNGDYYK